MKKQKKLAEYIEDHLRRGSITFKKEDAIKALVCTEKAFMRAAQRLKKKGFLIRPIAGFYVIVQAEFRDAGGPPPIHFLPRLMKYLGLPYYVGLLSAAKYHGATHQAVFETQVMTSKALRPIKYGKQRLHFITNKYTDKIPKQPLKTPHGDVQVSSPEVTAFDLLRYSKLAAGLSHIATVILEMKDKIDTRKFTVIADIYNDPPLAQRLGYLLEKIGGHSATPLQIWLKKRSINIVPLEPSAKQSKKINSKWSINLNVKVEPDEV